MPETPVFSTAAVAAPHQPRRRDRPDDPGRRRQRGRGHGRHGGDDRRGLSAHERARRRRLLARARAAGAASTPSMPPGRPARSPPSSATGTRATTPSRRAGPMRRSPSPGPSSGWGLALELARALGGQLPLDLLLGDAIRLRPRRLSRLRGRRGDSRSARRPPCLPLPALPRRSWSRASAPEAGTQRQTPRARRYPRPARPCGPGRFLPGRCRARDRRGSGADREPRHPQGPGDATAPGWCSPCRSG